jgi:hypothetical protein
VRCSVLFVVVVALAACTRPQAPPPKAQQPANAFVPARVTLGDTTVSLPKQVKAWTRPDAGRRITADSIFDYMDGAGEMYLAYRFDHLDVFEYKPAIDSAGTILVEIYSMKTTDDAFGLLSNDWGGEVPDFGRGPYFEGSSAVPSRCALYGGGLLRAWNGSLYVRVLAARETPDSREAVLSIGREVIAGTAGSTPLVRSSDGPAAPPPPPSLQSPPPPLPPPLPPAILQRLRGDAGGGLRIEPDRTCYFRSHLVLNSQYFLASADILGLGPDVDAATTEYRAGGTGDQPLRVIVVRYPSAERAAAGLLAFAKAYLPEVGARAGQAGTARVEQGWVGWASRSQDLAVVLDAASAKAAAELAASLLAGRKPPAASRPPVSK